MRTFSRDQWTEAQALWDDGHFSDEWKPYRHQAAMRGMLYPPAGDQFDSWEDDDPSQRAMLIRAIRETPALLSAAIGRSRSWGEVIAFVLRRRDEWREELNHRRPQALEPTPHQAMTAIGGVFERVAESMGYVRADRQLREREPQE